MDDAERIAAIDALTNDGDEFELEDGRKLVLRIEPDNASIEDIGGDWFGTLWGPYDYHTLSGRIEPRPDGCNGAGRKIKLGNCWYWWQPPADVTLTPDGVNHLRSDLIDLLTYGYSIIMVEMWEKCDKGCPHPIETQALGGIEPFPDSAYVQDVVEDLVNEFL